MKPLRRLLVVENEPKDLKLAAEVAHEVGVSDIEARTSLEAAKTFLVQGLNGEGPLPDGIVLDLDLGYESGYELLRFWHCTPELSNIPLIVWSVLGEEQESMCSLFKVWRYVAKWKWKEPFREALGELASSSQ